MKKLFSIVLMVLSVCVIGCNDNDDTFGEPKDKPYFYVEYYGSHWASVDFNQTCTMTITDENGQDVNYTLSNGSRKVVVGPVYVGFKASLKMSAPKDGGTDGRISIARNQDRYFTQYGYFSNAKKEETVTYTILKDTGEY